MNEISHLVIATHNPGKLTEFRTLLGLSLIHI